MHAPAAWVTSHIGSTCCDAVKQIGATVSTFAPPSACEAHNVLLWQHHATWTLDRNVLVVWGGKAYIAALNQHMQQRTAQQASELSAADDVPTSWASVARAVQASIDQLSAATRGSAPADGFVVHYLVIGATQYIAALQKAHARCGGELAPPTLHDLQVAETAAAITGLPATRHESSLADGAEYVAALTEAIAKAPTRSAPSALATITKVRVAKVAGGGSSDSESSRTTRSAAPTSTWQAVLQMIPGMSAARAARVAAKYPSLAELQCAWTAAGPAAAPGLLAKTLDPAREQRALSVRTHAMFTDDRPELPMGRE